MTAARPVHIAICDRMTPAYPNAGAFVQALCDALAIEWRRAGVDGIRILDAIFTDGLCQIVTGPGQARLDRAALRAFLDQKRTTS